MDDGDIVLTLEDLPTLRKLAKLARDLSDNYVPQPDIIDIDIYGIIPACLRYNAIYIEKLVENIVRIALS